MADAAIEPEEVIEEAELFTAELAEVFAEIELAETFADTELAEAFDDTELFVTDAAEEAFAEVGALAVELPAEAFELCAAELAGALVSFAVKLATGLELFTTELTGALDSFALELAAAFELFVAGAAEVFVSAGFLVFLGCLFTTSLTFSTLKFPISSPFAPWTALFSKSCTSNRLCRD